MFKALAALAAVTVCCLGNDYPAKSHHAHFGEDVLNRTSALGAAMNNLDRMAETARQEYRLRQIIREELN